MARETKADRILKEAGERMDAAKHRVVEVAQQLEVAQAVFNNLQVTYYALERALAPKPRKKADPKPAAPKQAEQKETKPVLCGTCGYEETWAVHDKSMGYAGYHPFVSTVTSARTVRRKSSRKESSSKADGASAASSETSTGAASAVAGG